METAKDISKKIRKDLKAAGYKSYSVRTKSGTLSDSIWITIPEGINTDIAKKIARKYEVYERDERTGEILEGGNTFIFVN